MKIESVAVLRRRIKEILVELHQSKEPVLITENGQSSAYLVEVESYKFMRHRKQILDGIARGETAIVEQCVFTQEQSREKMQKWLK